VLVYGSLLRATGFPKSKAATETKCKFPASNRTQNDFENAEKISFPIEKGRSSTY
jgi:hypothetical protein